MLLIKILCAITFASTTSTTTTAAGGQAESNEYHQNDTYYHVIWHGKMFGSKPPCNSSGRQSSNQRVDKKKCRVRHFSPRTAHAMSKICKPSVQPSCNNTQNVSLLSFFFSVLRHLCLLLQTSRQQFINQIDLIR